MQARPHRIAIYDMDKTITRAPTWTPFLVHAARERAPWRLALMPIAGLYGLGYATNLIDRARLKQLTQQLMVGRFTSRADMRALADSFAERTCATGLFEDARARIAQDHAQGFRLVLATASFGYYVESIAEQLGFDGVIATRSRFHDDDRITALIDGENCYGPGKLRMVEAWFADQGIDRADAQVRFYSDHVSDAPAMEWADEAFAANPHPPLRRLAMAKGWTVLDWGR